MQTSVTAYDILLSFPSDLASCTPYIKTAIAEFNNHFGRQRGIVLRPVYWRDDVFPETGHPAQTIINDQVAEGCDLVLACFWTRFGSPTDGFGSGTEEEIRNAMGAGKQVFVYFLEKAMPHDVDTAQLEAVRSFQREIGAEGLYGRASDEASLAADFRQKIELYFAVELDHPKADHLQGAQKRILWVDDRPENNAYIRRLLEEYGITFLIALSTADAQETLQYKPCALVISDMGRREGPEEGYVLLDALRSSGDDTPLVFFTASNSPEQLAETRRRGGQGFTNDGNELVSLVFKLLLSGSKS